MQLASRKVRFGLGLRLPARGRFAVGFGLLELVIQKIDVVPGEDFALLD